MVIVVIRIKCHLIILNMKLETSSLNTSPYTFMNLKHSRIYLLFYISELYKRVLLKKRNVCMNDCIITYYFFNYTYK